jgi:hypothetical protein
MRGSPARPVRVDEQQPVIRIAGSPRLLLYIHHGHVLAESRHGYRVQRDRAAAVLALAVGLRRVPRHDDPGRPDDELLASEVQAVAVEVGQLGAAHAGRRRQNPQRIERLNGSGASGL